MRRRELMGTGMSMLAAPFISTVKARQIDYEQIVSHTHGVAGLVTDLSQSGNIVLFGFDDGNAMVYSDDHDGEIISFDVDRSVSHIKVREEANMAVLGWMDADIYGLFDLATEDSPFVKHPGLWDIATTPDAGLTASVSNPSENSGSVATVDSEGKVLWETSFADATGQSVSISDGGNHIAVGAGHYWKDGLDPIGQPGIRFYDRTGTELWHHDHGEDVLSVSVDAERELVVAGAEDGLTIVLDFEGNTVWQTDVYGGWGVLSDDGGTVLTSEADGTLYSVDSATGEAQWTADIGMWPTEALSVSADGSRVFVADSSEAEFVIIEDGETIWSDSHEVGPGIGAIASDGSTWSTIVTNLDEETSLVEIYRAPDAVAEPEAAPEVDNPSDEEERDDEEDDQSDESGAPASLTLVDYHILGNSPSEEYITLRNTGDGTLDMSNWRVEDDGLVPENSLSPYSFPSGFTLEPEAEVTIVTGEGSDTTETLYWGIGRQVWSEDRDVVYVLDGSGEVVLEERIDAQPPPPASLELVDYYIISDNSNEEYVTKRNTGDDTLDVSGWRVRDRRDGGRVGVNLSALEFPSGFTLEPGAEVTIVSGDGENTDDTLYWDAGNQVWNEDGDVVIVLDADGKVILEQPIAAEPEPPNNEEPVEEEPVEEEPTEEEPVEEEPVEEEPVEEPVEEEPVEEPVEEEPPNDGSTGDGGGE